MRSAGERFSGQPARPGVSLAALTYAAPDRQRSVSQSCCWDRANCGIPLEHGASGRKRRCAGRYGGAGEAVPHLLVSYGGVESRPRTRSGVGEGPHPGISHRAAAQGFPKSGQARGGKIPHLADPLNQVFPHRSAPAADRGQTRWRQRRLSTPSPPPSAACVRRLRPRCRELIMEEIMREKLPGNLRTTASGSRATFRLMHRL